MGMLQHIRPVSYVDENSLSSVIEQEQLVIVVVREGCVPVLMVPVKTGQYGKPG